MQQDRSSLVVEVDFSAPGDVDPSDFGLEGLNGAAARVSVDLSPSTGLGASQLGQVRRGDAAAVQSAGKSWFPLRTSLGSGALLLDARLAVSVADLLMGGQGSAEPRPLTAVEERVITPHLQRALGPLSAVFSPSGVGPLTLAEAGRGPMALRGDSLIVEVQVLDPSGEEVLGCLTLVVPAPPVALSSYEPTPAGSSLWDGSWSFLDMPLPASVLTRPSAVPASLLRSLVVGEVLSLKHRAEDPLRLCVGPVDVGLVTLGRHDEVFSAIVVGVPDSQHARRAPSKPRQFPVLNPTIGNPSPNIGNPSPNKGDIEMSETSPDLDPPVAAALAAATDALEPPELPSPAVPLPTDPAATLGLLADVPVEVSVEVGRASIMLREAVALGPGQVVSLDAEAGALATVLVNGRAVARGQVVVVDEVYGVRITELVGD